MNKLAVGPNTLEEYKVKLIKLGLSKIDIKEELERYADEVKDQIERNKEWH